MSKNTDSPLVETRIFKPSREFSRKARIASFAEYKAPQSLHESPEKFWAAQAQELLWQKKWTKVLEWKQPFAKWFVGGKLNVARTAWTGTSGPRGKTRPRSSGRASRARSAR